MSVAVYPGTFDPITSGHLDIIRRSCRLFDHVYVAVAADTGAKRTLFTPEERVAMIGEVTGDLKRVEVTSFSGLLVEYARSLRATALIRGLRAVSDFEYELELALMNRHLESTIETVFLMTNGSYSFISSSMVKEVARLGGDVSDKVPPAVDRALKQKFKEA